jgi:hypothetical protein
MTKNANGHGRKQKLRGGRLRPDGSREHVYTPEIAAEICRRVSLGETLTVVCKSLGVDPAQFEIGLSATATVLPKPTHVRG